MRINRKLPAAERFELSIFREPNSGCWLWEGGVIESGYGQFTMNYRNMGAHRASWILHRGPIPPGTMVCHKCDTPSCVRPDHLFLGNSSTNMLDASAKGRISNGNRAKTHCIHGHELAGRNLMQRKTKTGVDGRVCRKCARNRYNKYIQANQRSRSTPCPSQ
jgi:hypothetical protein